MRWHCSCVQTVPALIAPRQAMMRVIRSRLLMDRAGSPVTRSLMISSITPVSSSRPSTTGTARTRKESLPKSSRTNPSCASSASRSRMIAASLCVG